MNLILSPGTVSADLPDRLSEPPSKTGGQSFLQKGEGDKCGLSSMTLY
jgi:hypothetical protein